MTIKPSDHGIVVEHKETGLRFASLDQHYNPDTMRKVRDLLPGETVLSYQPRYKSAIGDDGEQTAGASTDAPEKEKGN